MKADSFDDLVANCVLTGFKHRLLYVFVQVGTLPPEMAAEAGAEDEEAGFVQILFDAHQPVQLGLSFAQLKQTADAQTTDWNLVIVSITKNSDASLPTEDQAQGCLADMRDKILAGDLEEFAVIGRDGEVVDFELEEIEGDESPTIN